MLLLLDVQLTLRVLYDTLECLELRRVLVPSMPNYQELAAAARSAQHCSVLSAPSSNHSIVFLWRISVFQRSHIAGDGKGDGAVGMKGAKDSKDEKDGEQEDDDDEEEEG